VSEEMTAEQQLAALEGWSTNRYPSMEERLQAAHQVIDGVRELLRVARNDRDLHRSRADRLMRAAKELDLNDIQMRHLRRAFDGGTDESLH